MRNNKEKGEDKQESENNISYIICQIKRRKEGRNNIRKKGTKSRVLRSGKETKKHIQITKWIELKNYKKKEIRRRRKKKEKGKNQKKGEQKIILKK